MTLQTFFNKFDLIAEAPGAVPRLRRIILQLAVQGTLVPQDESDESADELLSRIRNERNRLITSGSIKNGKEVDPASREDLVFSIPDCWSVARLGEISACLDYMREPVNEATRNTRNLGKDPDQLYPYYGATHQQGWIDDYLFDEELVLLGEDGVPFFDDLRPKAYMISGKTWVNNHAHVFRAVMVDTRYLVHCLNVTDYEGLIAGTTRTKLNQAKALTIPIPLPPLAEQKRIVAKVDELMALCDRLEAQQQEREQARQAAGRAAIACFNQQPTTQNLQHLFHPQPSPTSPPLHPSSFLLDPSELRKTILTLAVQGKLVPQDPSEGTATIPSDVQIVGDSERVSRLQLPDTWLSARFESLLAVMKNGFNGKPSKVVGKFKVTRIETIARETIDLTRVGYADDLPGDVVAKHSVLKGDILFSHINSEPHLGKTAICTIHDPALIHGVNLLLIRPLAGIDSGYLNITLRELRASGYFVSIAQRAVNQASINQKNLGKTPIPIPPLAEQKRIVAKVDELMALVDAMEQQIGDANDAAARLLDALVAEITAPTPPP